MYFTIYFCVDDNGSGVLSSGIVVELNKHCFVCYRKFIFVILFTIFYVGHSSVVVSKLDSQSREPGFESTCFHFEALAILFTPRCHSSLSCK